MIIHDYTISWWTWGYTIFRRIHLDLVKCESKFVRYFTRSFYVLHHRYMLSEELMSTQWTCCLWTEIVLVLNFLEHLEASWLIGCSAQRLRCNERPSTWWPLLHRTLQGEGDRTMQGLWGAAQCDVLILDLLGPGNLLPIFRGKRQLVAFREEKRHSSADVQCEVATLWLSSQVDLHSVRPPKTAYTQPLCCVRAATLHFSCTIPIANVGPSCLLQVCFHFWQLGHNRRPKRQSSSGFAYGILGDLTHARSIQLVCRALLTAMADTEGLWHQGPSWKKPRHQVWAQVVAPPVPTHDPHVEWSQAWAIIRFTH